MIEIEQEFLKRKFCMDVLDIYKKKCVIIITIDENDIIHFTGAGKNEKNDNYVNNFIKKIRENI